MDMNGLRTTCCFPFWIDFVTCAADVESYHRVRWEEAVILWPLQRPMPPKDANGSETKDRKSSQGILVEFYSM